MPDAPIVEPVKEMNESFSALESFTQDAATLVDANPSGAASQQSTQEGSATGAAADLTKDVGSSTPKPDDSTSTQNAEPKPDDGTKPGEKPAEKPPEEPELKTPKALRDAYEALKLKHKPLEQTVKTLEAKLAELEKRPPAPADDPERKALTEKLTAAEKRLAELDEEMRYIDYERSSEFKTKYQEPYERLATSVVKSVTEINVLDENGTPRPSTPQEFWKVVTAKTVDEALSLAEQIYGSPAKAAYVMKQRDAVLESWQAMDQAKQEFRTKGAERVKQMQEQSAAQLKTEREMFTRLTTEAIEKYPIYFKPEEGDSKGNELLTKGFQMADLAFSDTSNLKPEERVALHAKVRNKAAGFDRLAYKFNTSQKRIAELEAELKAIRQSTPGSGDLPTGGKKPGTWEDELDKLAS